MHLCRSPSNVPRLPTFLKLLQNPHVLLTFGKVQNPLPLPRKTTSEPPKVVRVCGALYILTWKCASRPNGVHFFDISTSKSGPTLKYLLILTSTCASRHDGVQFFISHLARWLRTRRVSAATFSTLRKHKSLEKHSVSPLFYLFAHLHPLSPHSFSSLIFFLLLFSSPTLPASALPSLHIVNSLTPKLLSVIYIH